MPAIKKAFETLAESNMAAVACDRAPGSDTDYGTAVIHMYKNTNTSTTISKYYIQYFKIYYRESVNLIRAKINTPTLSQKPSRTSHVHLLHDIQ